jgi:hypothetical protein
VLEEVALAQSNRRWLSRKRTVLQRGGAALHDNCEQGAREREREPCELLKLEQHEGKALLTWGRRRPRRPVAVALSALRGMEDAVIRMRCHMHARPVTGCERFKRLLRLTSGPGFIS